MSKTRALTITAVLLTAAACTLGAYAWDREPALRAIERGEGDGLVVVLMHGYGSRPEHIESMADRTDLPSGTRFSFPYAPEAMHPPYGPVGTGFMWWPFEANDFHDLRSRHLPGVAAARARVRAYLDETEERLGIGSERIVLGGFSQGAILALDVALHDDRPLAGLVLLSGTLVEETEIAAHVASRRGLRVYMSHGTEDTVLPYDDATDLAELLRGGGLEVEMRSFDGGHVVPPPVGYDVARFLADVGG